jgi:hypothetical protein
MAAWYLPTAKLKRLFKDLLHNAAVPEAIDNASCELDVLRTQMLAADLASEIERLLEVVHERKMALVLSGAADAAFTPDSR